MEESTIQEIEDLSAIGDISLVYSKLKGIKKGYLPRTLFCKETNDKLIIGHGNVTERWVEYFEELLNRQSNDEREIQFNNDDYDVNDENCERPTVEVIRDAIAKFKNAKLRN